MSVPGHIRQLTHTQTNPKTSEKLPMINRIADVTTKRAPLANIPEALIQARQIQAHIKEQITEGQLHENSRPSWVEIAPGDVLAPVIRWIE